MTACWQERIAIPGAAGLLAGELAYPTGAPRAAVLLLNPHPLMGGRMDNNVIAHVAEALAAAGTVTLRFDYRGVGRSNGPAVDVPAAMAEFWAHGRTPHDPLMIDDGRAALLWLRRSVRLPLFVIGYSFGAHVGAHIMPADARGIILITPTLTHHDFAPAEHTPFNALVVVGQSDFATPLEHTMHWARSLPGSTSVRVLSGGGHFFRGIEPRVADACLSFIESTLTSMEPASCTPA